jgi:Tfp pilus assembly protein PilP
MKRKALIAMVLLVVVTLLAGCGGVSQKDLDAAVADKDAALAQVTTLRSQLTTAQSDLSTANTAKAAATASLATAQADLTKAKADLASATSSLNASKAEVTTLTAKVADLTKQVADLKAAAAPPVTPPVTPPAAFTGTKYTDSTYGFSFKYPTTWVAASTLPKDAIAKFGGGAYNLPCVFAGIEDQAANATLEAAFKVYVTANSYTWKTYTATSVTIGSVACTKADVTYTSAYGDIIGTIVGFTKNNKWVFIGAVTISSLGDWSTATEKNDIIGSITFP